MVRKLEDWYYYSMATFLAVLLVFLVAVLPGRADIHTGPERIAPYEQTETERGCRYQIRLGKRDSEGQSIAFLTEHQLLRVYADSALIYSVGESDSLVFGRTPGKRWNFVELSAGVQTIVVETEDLYGVSYNSIPDFFFGIRSEIEEELMRESFTKATISIFLMIAGLFLIINALFSNYGKVPRATSSASHSSCTLYVQPSVRYISSRVFSLRCNGISSR